MFKNYFKISIRQLWQSKLYSLINVFGLAAGITALLLASLYWKDEHSYDNFHANNPNLYRITTSLSQDKREKVQLTGGTGQVQGPAFKAQVPEINNYVRVMGGDIYNDVSANNKTLHLQPLFVDESFFDVFTFKLLRGNPGTVLNNINSVVITENTAKKFFNSIDVVGKLLQIDADPSFQKLNKPLVVSGVVENPPQNSSLQFDALFTFKFMNLSFKDENWLNAYLGTFVVLRNNADVRITEQKFNTIFALHAKEQLAENFKSYGYDPQITYGLQPFTNIHLNTLVQTNSNSEGGIINGSSPVYSYVFICIALFILLMAVINFINISIANSLKRAKEVGIRKIAGGSRMQIIIQLLHEYGILCITAFLLSLVLAEISLPVFNNLSGKSILFSEAFDAKLLAYFVLVLVIIVLVTGVFPAYILSGFKPSVVLYGKQKLSGRGLFGRGLVVVQFILAELLLIATIVYYNQMDYIRTKDLGYNPSQVIRTVISGNRDYKMTTSYLKNQLAKEPSVKQVSFGNVGSNEDMEVNGRTFKAIYKNIDENFLSALEIPVIAGQNLPGFFSEGGSYGVIVNEAFVKAAAMYDPIGKTMKVNGYHDSTLKTILGVVRDFHFGSLREPIKPMVMYLRESPDGNMLVKFEKSKQKDAMAALERIYKKAMPDAVYQIDFLDELNARQYLQEQRWQQVTGIATIVTFIICCLGLFGLAHLSTKKRTREIGIRKVLGASVEQIITLISGDFLKLVMVAYIIAAPVAWVVMNRWLLDFAYRINIAWWVFVFAGGLTAVIALLTVSFQSITAAIANPVKSLRTE